MKKTVFDKVVIGFVLLVIVIFSVLSLYTVQTTQSRLLNNTEKNLNIECQLIINTTVTEYLNGTISESDFFTKMDGYAELLESEIWFSTSDGTIIYCSNSDSTAKNKQITDYYDKSDIYASTTKKGKLNNYFSARTLSIGMPLYQNNSYAGLLTVHLPLQFLQDVVKKHYRPSTCHFLLLCFFLWLH